MTVVMNVVSKLGLQAFGIAMPRIAWTLINNNATGNFTEDPGGQPLLTLQGVAPNQGTPIPWVAPLAGITREVDTGAKLPLIRTDGTLESGPGVLLTLHPQLYTRLCRLYATLLEGPATYPIAAPAAAMPPFTGRGVPVRPVPRYFWYSTDDMSQNVNVKLSGNVSPGDDLGFFRWLRVYDNEGLPIDPLAVLSALNRLLFYYPSTMWLPSLTLDPTQNGFLGQVASFVTQNQNPNQNLVRIRLCDHEGKPRSSLNNLGNTLATIDQAHTAAGIFNLTGGLGGNVTTTGLSSPSKLVIGSPHSGTLGTTFTPPALPDYSANIPGVLGFTAPPAPAPPAMFRDMFTLRALDLDDFLLGTPDPAFARPAGANTSLERRSVVRMQESLTLLAHGNDVLGAALGVLTNPAGQQFQCVAQSIRNDFAVPPVPNNMGNTLWPAFPNVAGGPAILPATWQLGNFAGTARYIQPPGAPMSPDVLLTLTNLPANTAAIVFPRKFVSDAQEQRGDPAGAVVAVGNPTSVQFVLRNPLGGISLTANLRFDLQLVSTALDNNGQPISRMYGNQAIPLNSNNPVAPPATMALNGFQAAGVFTGTSRADVLGLAATAPPSLIDWLSNFLGVENEVPGTDNREAPRLPTMAHRELVVSDRRQAVLAAGRLEPESLSAQGRRGSPGVVSDSRRETQVIGVATAGTAANPSRLAGDQAIAALRRTAFLPVRLINLVGNPWDPPPTPANTGTLAAAVLQNVAPQCDMPSLYHLHDQMGTYAGQQASLTALSDLVNWINNQLAGKTVSLFGQNVPVEQAVTSSLNSMMTSINNLAPARTNAQLTRARDELDRALVTSVYGRRDSQWALRGILKKARRFIYIESPGLCSTNLDANGQPTNDDLLEIIRQRMIAMPHLCVTICIPKFSDYPQKYGMYKSYELTDRKNRIAALVPADNVRVFHPIGFPGRVSRLESTLVVVDDVWALIGSSTFRRRGLAFDGSLDMVLTDTVYEHGCCPAIANFRRNVMASRLGVLAQDAGGTNPPLVLPHPNFVRLRDGVEAFHVVSELLEAGGGGCIEPFYNTLPADAAPVAPVAEANPDGADVVADLLLWQKLFIADGIN